MAEMALFGIQKMMQPPGHIGHLPRRLEEKDAKAANKRSLYLMSCIFKSLTGKGTVII